MTDETQPDSVSHASSQSSLDMPQYDRLDFLAHPSITAANGAGAASSSEQKEQRRSALRSESKKRYLDKVSAHRGRARQLFQEQKFAEAATEFTAAIELNPAHPKGKSLRRELGALYSNRAACWLHLLETHSEACIADTSRALELNPQDEKALMRRAFTEEFQAGVGVRSPLAFSDYEIVVQRGGRFMVSAMDGCERHQQPSEEEADMDPASPMEAPHFDSSRSLTPHSQGTGAGATSARKNSVATRGSVASVSTGRTNSSLSVFAMIGSSPAASKVTTLLSDITAHPLKTGYLSKAGAKRGLFFSTRMRRRYFVLDGDRHKLHYLKTSQQLQQRAPGAHCTSIELRHRIVKAVGDVQMEIMFPNNPEARTFLLQATCKEERDSWMQAIRDEIVQAAHESMN